MQLATFYLGWPSSTTKAAGDLVGIAAAAIGVLLVSVLAHEWSHWLVARRCGTDPDTLVIGPLGGLSQWGRSTTPRCEFACLLAGPAANLLICLVCVMVLLVVTPHIELARLFNPLEPVWTLPHASGVEQGLGLTLWINWLLFLFNLLPAFPFDGGRLLRCVISWARPQWTERRCAETIFWVALALTGVIALTALFLWKNETDSLFPVSFALLLVAVVLLVSARRDAEKVEEVVAEEVYDTELADPWPVTPEHGGELDEPALVDRWEPDQVALDDEPAGEEIEAEEERQVDLILSRLHAHGMDSLTPEQRQLLERVSARYRDRLGRHT